MMVFDRDFEAEFFQRIEDRVGIVSVQGSAKRQRAAAKKAAKKAPGRLQNHSFIDTRARVSMDTSVSTVEPSSIRAAGTTLMTFALSLSQAPVDAIAAVEPELIVDDTVRARTISTWRRTAPAMSADAQMSPDAKQIPAVQSAADLAWDGYLGRIAKGRGKHITFVREVWALLRTRNRELPPPQTAPTESGAIAMVWDSGEHHLEVTVNPSKMIEWFYSNRVTGLYEGEDDNRLGSLSRRLTGHIKNIKNLV